MSWQSLPIHRHLATIGIGAVFVCPPPYPLPHHEGEEDLTEKNGDTPVIAADEIIPTWEIHGDIKSTPGDFIVREIGVAPTSKQYLEPDVNADEEKEKPRAINNIQGGETRPGWCRSIAGLDCEARCITTSLVPQIDAGYRLESTCGESSHNRYDDLKVEPEREHESLALEQPNSENIKYSNRNANSNEQTDINTIPESQRKDLPSIQNERKEAKRVGDGEIQPVEKLRQILVRCTTNNEIGITSSETKRQKDVEQFIEKLSSLQTLANEEIRNRWDQGYSESRDCDVNRVDVGDKDDKNNSGPVVWIPTSNLFDDTSDSKIDKKEDWRHLHQCIREAFPFLRTEVPNKPNSLEKRSAKENGNVADESEYKNDRDTLMSGCNSINFTKPWVCALIDRTLFPLASFLYDPNVDLLELYKFRQRGPIPPNSSILNNSRGNNRSQRDQKRRRKDDRILQSKTQQTQQQTADCGENETIQTKKLNSREGFVVLRLRPELPRDRRRNIHKILSGGGSQRRDFETITICNFPLNGGSDSQIDCNNIETATTTAIMVHWSNKALSSLQKKRKRKNDYDADANPYSKANESIMATFCVLRKEQVEHQAAVQHIARALKCKQQDIGLAGIKDMQAITYQFCTLRGINIQRAKRANHALSGKRIELSRFEEVYDFLLNRGNLIGNRFEVVLRNLKRIERMTSKIENGAIIWKERAIPCVASHLDAMVKRVREFGFVNFYGEQRVGDAGHSSRVGVRSYDVGRAMLRQNFAQAIDLIMAGRSYGLYHPGDDEVKAREIWKTSGGNAKATLNAFPKSASTMVRERDLMKGLVRYGDPLEAIQCVPRNVRMFWIHSYQSYVWNIVATERIKLWGLHAKIGDLYEVSSFEKDGTKTDNINVVEEPDAVSIYQVVLPLPGYNMKYPSNEIGALYNNILENDGVQLNEKCNIHEATAKGSYRKLIQKATNLKWEKLCEGTSEDEDPVVDAVQLSFELESGCYATMLLRELMLTTMVRDGKISAS